MTFTMACYAMGVTISLLFDPARPGGTRLTATRQAVSETVLHQPIIGYGSDDEGRSIFPIRGIPGAATVGEPIRVGRPFRRARISPGQGYALLLAEDGRSVMVAALDRDSIQPALVLEDETEDLDQLVLSSNGSAVALVSGNVLRVWSGLPSTPALLWSRQLPSTQTNFVIRAVHDDGLTLVLTDPQGQTMLVQAGHPDLLLSNSPARAAAFSTGHLVLLYSSLSETWRVEMNHWIYFQSTPLPEVSWVSGETYLEVLAGERTALFANRGSDSIHIIDFESGSTSRVMVPRPVTSFDRMFSKHCFLFSSAASAPTWLFSAIDGQAFFVPASIPSTLK